MRRRPHRLRVTHFLTHSVGPCEILFVISRPDRGKVYHSLTRFGWTVLEPWAGALKRHVNPFMTALVIRSNGAQPELGQPPRIPHRSRETQVIRLGLCCAFQREPIKFPTTTVAALSRRSRTEQLARLSGLCLMNAEALLAALKFCSQTGIGCFRVNSQILPVKTHPQIGYEVEELPDSEEIVRRFQMCRQFASDHGIRTCFHPDQFVVLNSPRSDVLAASVRELEYQAEVAEWIGADVINIHGGGAYGNKASALTQLARNFERLSRRVQQRLTLENDDKTYSPADLLPVCKSLGVPFVYDVHHHRCLPDGLTIEQATEAAIATWTREPLFHVSSPAAGWTGEKPERHHDFIDEQDFPSIWRDLNVTVEVEARAKEIAVLKLQAQLNAAPRGKLVRH